MGVQSRRGMRQHLAHYIREQTKDGDDLIDFVLSVFQGKINGRVDKKLKANLPLRLDAASWLTDRGWGKPPQHIELDVGDNIRDGDLRQLDTKVLEAVLRAMDDGDPEAAQLALTAPIPAKSAVITETYSA